MKTYEKTRQINAKIGLIWAYFDHGNNLAGGGYLSSPREPVGSVSSDGISAYSEVYLNEGDISGYNSLLHVLAGDNNATIDTVTALAQTNNNQFASSGYTGTDASAIGDAIVYLNDLSWIPVYLSIDKNEFVLYG